MSGTVVVVHGTGVRLASFERALTHAKQCAVSSGITDKFTSCAWGDLFGVDFEGLSLPDFSGQNTSDEELDFAQWNWILDDPLTELDRLTIRGPPQSAPIPIPGRKPSWEIAWDRILAYKPSIELRTLLERHGYWSVWDNAWEEILLASPIPKLAFEASSHELPEASQALARAVIAQIHLLAASQGVPPPTRAVRTCLVERLLIDWDQKVFGLSDFCTRLLKRAATRVLREHRNTFSNHAALPVGDVLLYQSHGDEIRSFIRKKVEAASQPITLIGHSLGGVACVDLLALPGAPKISGLVTAGSQAPLLYEMGALASLRKPQPLPSSFPSWVNFFDRNDFLSYIAARLFPGVIDHEIRSGLPFPESHSAYFGDPEFWKAVKNFMEACKSVARSL